MILEIIPEQISDDAWSAAYDATLRLLLAPPSRLLGLDWMPVCGVMLPVYTKTIERYTDFPERRRWCVVGDQATLQVAETQTMHRSIEHYRRGGAGPGGVASPIADVLEAAVDERAGRNAGLMKVFGDDAQGQPYELFILAAAMVVESRLPLAAMISGHVERRQAEAAQRFAEATLQTPVALPLRVDGPRLAERLGRLVDGEAIRRLLERLRIDTPPAAAQVRRRSKLEEPPSALDDLLILPSPDELSPALRGEVHSLSLAVRRLQSRFQDGAARGPLQRPAARTSLLAVLDSGDASALRRTIAQALSERGPTLTIDAWSRIAREEDVEVLRFLLATALVRPSWLSLFQLQRAMFENEALCHYAADASRNQALMAELAEELAPKSRRS